MTLQAQHAQTSPDMRGYPAERQGEQAPHRATVGPALKGPVSQTRATGGQCRLHAEGSPAGSLAGKNVRRRLTSQALRVRAQQPGRPKHAHCQVTAVYGISETGAATQKAAAMRAHRPSGAMGNQGGCRASTRASTGTSPQDNKPLPARAGLAGLGAGSTAKPIAGHGTDQVPRLSVVLTADYSLAQPVEPAWDQGGPVRAQGQMGAGALQGGGQGGGRGTP